jgi:DNA-binding transcriptional regulator YiaG
MNDIEDFAYELVINEFAEMLDESGLVYTTIADVFGVHKNTIKSWVTGRRCAPPFALKKMQLLLDIVKMED